MSGKTRRFRGRHAGFTLLELLLASALLSVIAGSIMGGVRLGTRAFEIGRGAEAMNELDEVPRALERLLSRAVLVPLPAGSGGNAPAAFGPQVAAFEGRADGCRFVMLSEGEANWGGLIETEIAGAPAGGGSELRVWTKVFRVPDWKENRRDDSTAVRAAPRVAYLEFGYFGPPPPQTPAQAPQAPTLIPGREEPPVWSDVWADRTGLPQLIAVRLGLERNGRVVDMSFTVAVRQK